MVNEIFKNEENEIIYMNNEIFFIHDDKVYYFDPNNFEDIIVFIQLMKHYNIQESKRARILGKILNS